MGNGSLHFLWDDALQWSITALCIILWNSIFSQTCAWSCACQTSDHYHTQADQIIVIRPAHDIISNNLSKIHNLFTPQYASDVHIQTCVFGSSAPDCILAHEIYSASTFGPQGLTCILNQCYQLLAKKTVVSSKVCMYTQGLQWVGLFQFEFAMQLYLQSIHNKTFLSS